METIPKEPTYTPGASSLPGGNVYEQPAFTRREIFSTMTGVLLVMLLASLDQTIVGTAMPRIIGEFHGLDRYVWVTTAYMLTSTVMIPIYGKLSDQFGRKPIFLVGVVLFLLGSGLCGAAQSMDQLIIFRAFQGIGAAALMPIAIAVIGDLFTPRERGKWQGVTGSIFALSSILGPVLGGWITDSFSWRWVFYVNLPVGVAALLVLIFLMPMLRQSRGKARIDYLGALLLALGTVPVMLGLSGAGSQFAWLSWQTLVLIGGGLIVMAGFFFYEAYLERHDAQPIIDPSLFKNRIFIISLLVSMITFMGMFGCVAFLPLYAQGVLKISATDSGLVLTPMMLSMIATSTISGLLLTRFGKYKWMTIVGMIGTVLGAALLLRLDVHSYYFDMIIAMIVLGTGMGFGMSLYNTIVQNALPHKIGQATSAMTFFRQIGSTVALAALGSILTSMYAPAFHSALPAQVNRAVPSKALSFFDNPNVLLDPNAQHAISTQFASFGQSGMALLGQILEAVKVGLTQGIHATFVASFIVLLFGMVIVFFLPEIELISRRSPANKDDAPSVPMMH